MKIFYIGSITLKSLCHCNRQFAAGNQDQYLRLLLFSIASGFSRPRGTPGERWVQHCSCGIRSWGTS